MPPPAPAAQERAGLGAARRSETRLCSLAVCSDNSWQRRRDRGIGTTEVLLRAWRNPRNRLFKAELQLFGSTVRLFEAIGNVCVTVEPGLQSVAIGSSEDNYGRAGMMRAAINVSVLTDHKIEQRDIREERTDPAAAPPVTFNQRL